MNPKSELEQGKTLVGRYLTEEVQALNLTISEVEWHRRFYEKNEAKCSVTYRVSSKRRKLEFAVSDLDTIAFDQLVQSRVRERIRHELGTLAEAPPRIGFLG